MRLKGSKFNFALAVGWRRHWDAHRGTGGGREGDPRVDRLDRGEREHRIDDRRGHEPQQQTLSARGRSACGRDSGWNISVRKPVFVEQPRGAAVPEALALFIQRVDAALLGRSS
eukprot:6095041-Pyramimonas_sp.AAC.1